MPDTVIERNVNHDTIKSLKELSLKYIESIGELKGQIKEANQMIKDALVGDVAYLDASEKTKEVQKKLTVEKKRVQSRPDIIQLAIKLKTMRDELKEKKSSLSDYLLEYERLSGADVIDGPKGEQLSIFKKAEVTRLPSRGGGE
jgi:hypothetical protein